MTQWMQNQKNVPQIIQISQDAFHKEEVDKDVNLERQRDFRKSGDKGRRQYQRSLNKNVISAAQSIRHVLPSLKWTGISNHTITHSCLQDAER